MEAGNVIDNQYIGKATCCELRRAICLLVRDDIARCLQVVRGDEVRKGTPPSGTSLQCRCQPPVQCHTIPARPSTPPRRASVTPWHYHLPSSVTLW